MVGHFLICLHVYFFLKANWEGGFCHEPSCLCHQWWSSRITAAGPSTQTSLSGQSNPLWMCFYLAGPALDRGQSNTLCHGVHGWLLQAEELWEFRVFIKGCALACSAQERLLQPCFSNCWFRSRCPLTHSCYCVTSTTHMQWQLSFLPFLSVSLSRHFLSGFEWVFPDLEPLPFCVHRAYLFLSLFLIGGEEAKRESQKRKWNPSWVLWQKGLGNSWGRQNCLWTQLNFRFLLQKTAFSHSGTAYFKTKFCSYMQNHSSFFSPFSFTLALSLKTLSPCAKSSLGCTPVNSIPNIGFIQLKWFH